MTAIVIGIGTGIMGSSIARLLMELELKGQITNPDVIALTAGVDLADGEDITVVIDSITGLAEELVKGEVGRVDGFRIVGSSYQIPPIREPQVHSEPRKKKAQWKTERQRWSKR